MAVLVGLHDLKVHGRLGQHENFSNTALTIAKSSNIMRSLIFLHLLGRGRLYSRHIMPYHSLQSMFA